MKSYKKLLAAFLAVTHVLTFSAPAQQINIQEGTTLTVDSIQVNAGESLTINVVDQLGQVCPSCRGILETNNFLNNGAIDIWGILAIIAPTIVNNGSITVQGDLLLSNLGINQEQFFAGIAELSKDPSLASGYILNTGDITNLTQGLLALVAANGGVHNLGTISSNGGAVVLAAGDRASFPLTRDGVLNIDLDGITGVKGQVFDKDGNLIDTKGLVTNAGVLQANGGAVVLQAAGAEAIYDSIINHTGIIEAKSVAQENGKIILKSETGNIRVTDAVIDASGYGAGEKGGKISLLTKGNIIVDGTTVVDASGTNGGGEILIGGDVTGSGSLNASNVGINSDVKVKADAVTSGNGGKIVVWSEGTTLAYGDFSAKGGAQFGNGGFIETSGKEFLDVDGIDIDASAVNGEAGTWLLDPYNIQIRESSERRGSFNGGNPDVFTPTDNAAWVSAADISSKLNAGTNVTITTGSDGAQPGDITFQNAAATITMNTVGATTATLTFLAAGSITIGAAITATGSAILNLVLQAGSGISIGANISTGGGNASFTANGGSITVGNSVETDGGDATFNASSNIAINQHVWTSGGNASFTAGTNIDIDNGVSTSGGDATFVATGGNIDMDQVVHTGGGNASFTAANQIDIDNQLVTEGGSATFLSTLFNNTQNINTSNFPNGGGDVTITADDASIGSIINAGSGTVFLKNKTAGTTFGLGSDVGDFWIDNDEASRFWVGAVEIGTATAGNIQADSFESNAAPNLVLRTGSNVIGMGGGTNLGAGNLAIHAGGGVNFSETSVNTVAVSAGGDVVLNNSGFLTVGTVKGLSGVSTTSGDITIDTSSSLTLEQNVSAGSGRHVYFNSIEEINQTGGVITANQVRFSARDFVSLAQSGNTWNYISGSTESGAINIADSGTNTRIDHLQTVGADINYEHTGAGNVTIEGFITSGDGSNNGGNITINSSNALTVASTATLDSAVGAGGVFSAGSAVVELGSTVNVGAGDITLGGGATILDTIINTPIINAANIVLTALRDVIVSASVTGPAATNMAITADSDLDGDGGVWLKTGADINSDANLTITGSKINDIGANGESVRIDAGATVDAVGDITIQHSSVAPAGADILINGVVSSSGVGTTIDIDSLGRIDTSNDGASNINADNIALESVEGIDVEVDADNLSYNNSASGDIAVEDMLGGLTLTGATNGGSGSATILTHSPLTIAADMIQAGTINLTALESVDTDDHVIVNAGFTVQATGVGSDVNITAGDDVNLNGTLVKSDLGAVNITAGSADTDDIGSVNLAGDVQAATTLTLNALTTGGLLGLISQTAGAITAVDLVVNADGSADLNQAGNDVDTLSATTGGTVTYQDADSLDLKASTIGGGLNLTTGGNLTDSGAVVVTGTTSLTAGVNDITLDNANDFSTVNVVSAKDVTISDINSLTFGDATLTGALSLTADSDNDTVGANLTTGAISATSVSLSGGTDNDDIINLNGDVTATAGGVTAQNAATVNLADSVDVTATGGAISFVTGIAQILLGATGANVFTTNSEDAITLGTVNGAGANLTIISNSDVTLGDVNLGVNGDLTVDVDNNDAVGGSTGTFGAITARNLSIEGHNLTSPDENFTFNGAINLTGDYDIGGLGILTYNNDVTAKSITIHDISVRVQLGDNVDLTATNGILSVVTNVAMILLAGADGTLNVFDGNGDFNVNLGAISATNNPNLTINSEADISLTSANIGTGTLTLAVDNDNDSVSTGSFGALTAGTISAGGTSDDNLDFNAAVVANTAGVTISNANNVDFDSTVNTATDLTQTTGSGTTTFSGLATVGGNADITTGTIVFNGANGSINSNTGTGAVKLTATTGGITSGTAASDVVAGSLEVQSANGIDLDTAITNVAFNNTAGAVAIRNTGALTVNNVGALATSNNTGTITTLSAASPITFAVNTTSAGNLTATAGETAGAGDDLTVNAGVTVKSTGGDVLLQAGDDVNLAATSAVQSDTGSVTLTGGFNDAADTFGSVSLGGAVTAATSAVIAALVGSVNGGGLVTANTADIDAVAGIGDTTALNTSVSNISADTTNDNIDINNNLATAVDATSLTTGTGTINFDQTGGGNLTVTSAVTGNGDITVTNDGGNISAVSVTAGTAAVADGNVNLTTTTSGNISLGTVNALGDTATITSAGTIGELANDDAGVQSSDINAGTINLTTGGGDIGEISSFLDITPTTLWNATSNGGDIYVSCIGVCPMGQIDAGTGFFYYAGNVTDGNDLVNGEVAGGLWNITAGGVHLDADNTVAGFIGEVSNWIEMRLARDLVVADPAVDANGLFVAASGTGGIHISNDVPSDATLGLQVGSAGAMPLVVGMLDGVHSTGAIEIHSFSPLVIAANVVAAGNIGLHSNGALLTDNLTVNAGVNVQTTGLNNTLNLTAGNIVTITAGATVQNNGSGQTNILAGEDFTDLAVDQDGNVAGDVVIQDTATVTSGTGKIVLDARDSVQVTGVSTGNTGDAINVIARTGNVTDGGDTNTDLTAGGATGRATINAATGVGSTGTGVGVTSAIETNIGQLDVTNTTSGNIQVDEVIAGSDLDIIRSSQSAPTGETTIRTLGGILRVLNAGSGGLGVAGLAGEMLLSATGGNLAVENTVTSTTGKINLDSTTNDVAFTAAGDVTATGGAEIEVFAQGSITMANGTRLIANGGGTGGASGDVGAGIDLDAANGNISLGSVRTTSSAATSRGDANDAVTIHAANGAVTDAGNESHDIFANSGQVTIVAANGVGAANNLETRIDRLDIQNTASGRIGIREQNQGGALNIVRVAQSAPNDDVDIRTGNGHLTVLAETSITNLVNFVGVAGLAGEIFLRAQGGGNNDDLSILNQVESTTGKINLDSTSRDVIASAEGDVTATGGGEIESDARRHITMADGTVWNANGGGAQGGIDLDALNGNITLGSVQTSNASDNAVTIYAENGAIIDGGDIDRDIVNTGNGGVILSAQTGVGSRGTGVNVNPNGAANNFATDAIDMTGAGTRLSAFTESGDIQIQNIGGLEITTLADNDGGTPVGSAGAGVVTGVQINDPLVTDPNSIIFITAASPITVSSVVRNFDGGNISMYALGNTALDTMTVNANVQSFNGNGEIRLVSGGAMTTGAGVNISTQNDGVTSGTGRVAIGAGFDATGKAADASIDVNPAFAPDTIPGLSPVSLASTSTAPSGSLLDTAGDTAASFTMDETSTVSTESGRIIVDAQNNFTVGRVDADGNAGTNGITDGLVGNILAFARNGSILDAEGPGEVGNLDFVANSLTMLAAGTIGLSDNRIEGVAPFLNTFSIGSQFIRIVGDTQVEMTSASGSISLIATGSILLGHMFAPSGVVQAIAGGSIFSQGGGETRVIASNLIELIANGIIGTTSNPIHTHLNATPAQMNLSAAGQAPNGVSIAVFGNVSPAAINFLTNPPGLALFNGAPVAGQTLSSLIGNQSSLYYKAFVRGLRQYNDFDGNYAADFPGFMDYTTMSATPDISVDTTGLDIPLRGITTAPRVVPIPTPAQPTPVTPSESTLPPVTDQTVQSVVPASEPTPPAVVPIPANAVASDQAQTDEGVPETPAVSN